MNGINLQSHNLKTFTEQDAIDYCSINNLNINKITLLFFNFNQLTDVSGIKIFKNLKRLYIGHNEIKDISCLKDLKELRDLYICNNKIKDISVIEYLTKLRLLDIRSLELESDQIEYIKSLKKLKSLWPEKGFKNMKVLKQLKI